MMTAGLHPAGTVKYRRALPVVINRPLAQLRDLYLSAIELFAL